MKRTLVMVAVVVAFAAAASASTLTVVSNALTYSPGATITLTVSGSQTGGSVNGVFGRLDYTGVGSVVTATGTETQKLVGKAAEGWQAGPLGHGAAFSYSFNQLNGSGGGNASNLPASNPFSTITVVAGAVGLVNVDWHTIIDGDQLNFFGLSTAPGTSFTIIPEPGTAALLGLGLIGILVGGRRRS